MSTQQPDSPPALYDRLQDLKSETKTVVNSAVSQLAESGPLKKLSENDRLRSIGAKLFGVGAATTEAIESLVGADTGADGDAVVTAAAASAAPTGFWGAILDWISRHKLLSAVIAASAAGGAYYYWYQVNMGNYIGPSFIRLRRRRLAHKAANGARVEVVVLAGSPAEPLTRTIATDLSRRGFIIYWTTSTDEEEALVLQEDSDDIRPLPIRAHDISSVRRSIKALANVLNVPATAFPGAIPHMLSLAGVIVVPDLYYPAGPVEAIRVDTWSDVLNSKILGPVFLLSNGLLDLVRSHQSRVLLVSPSIMGSLNPGYNAAEGMMTAALGALSLSLARELKPQGIPFIHIRMGTFNLSAGNVQHERQVQNAVRADILNWPENLRSIYSRPYQAMSALHTRARLMGSPLRVLNYTIFDALTDPDPKRVYYAGKNAFLYHFFPKYLSEDFVSWMLHPPPPRVPLAIEKGWEPL